MVGCVRGTAMNPDQSYAWHMRTVGFPPQSVLFLLHNVKLLSGHSRGKRVVNITTLLSRSGNQSKQKTQQLSSRYNSPRNYVRWTWTHSLPLCQLVCVAIQMWPNGGFVPTQFFFFWTMRVWGWCHVFFKEMKTLPIRYIDRKGRRETQVPLDTWKHSTRSLAAGDVSKTFLPFLLSCMWHS